MPESDDERKIREGLEAARKRADEIKEDIARRQAAQKAAQEKDNRGGRA
jgi:hypothetical protein